MWGVLSGGRGLLLGRGLAPSQFLSTAPCHGPPWHLPLERITGTAGDGAVSLLPATLRGRTVRRRTSLVLQLLVRET